MTMMMMTTTTTMPIALKSSMRVVRNLFHPPCQRRRLSVLSTGSSSYS